MASAEQGGMTAVRMEVRAGARLQQIVVAMVVAAVGVAVLLGAGQIPEPMGGAVVGPRAAAWAVGGLVSACGILLMVEAFRGGWACEVAEEGSDEGPDLWPMLLLGAGMLTNVLLIKTTGFIIATTLMFVFTARAFGARRLWLATLIGFALALSVYFGFARLLDLRIGGGWIEDFL